MISRVLIAAAVTASLLASPAFAAAKKPAAKAATHVSHKGCKGEFMYTKGGKCMDSRNKA
jgi:hypothetical protein